MGISDASVTIQGGTDGTEVGNDSDSLKVKVTNPTDLDDVHILGGTDDTPIGNIEDALKVAPTHSVNHEAEADLDALDEHLDIDIDGCATVGIQVTGTWNGRLVSQGSNDGTNWIELYVLASPEGGVTPHITQNGHYRTPIGGFAHYRLYADQWTSGSAHVHLVSTDAPSIVKVWQTNPDSLWATLQSEGSVSPGTAGTMAMLSAGIYNSSAPTLTNGQQAALQLTSDGRLMVQNKTSSLSQVTIEFPHYMIHMGRCFSYEEVFTLGSSATREYIFTPAASGTRSPHYWWQIDAKGDTSISIFEDPTTTSDGTAVTPVNRHRGSANTTTITLKHTPTLTSDGTQFCTFRSGMGGSAKSGTSSVEGSEYIFKVGKKYLIRITSNESSNIINFRQEWYEYDYTSATG